MTPPTGTEAGPFDDPRALRDDDVGQDPPREGRLLQTAIRHGLQYGAASIASRAAALLLVPVYTRFLAPADYGQLDLLIAFASLINLTIALEVSQGVARYYIDAPNEADRRAYASTSLWFSLAVYTIFAAIALIAATPISEIVLGAPRPDLLAAATVWIWSSGIFYLVQNQIRWKLDPRGFGVASIIALAGSIVASVALVVVGGLGVAGVLLGQSLGNGLGLLIGLVLVRPTYGPTFEVGKLREMLRFSVPLVPSSIGVFVSLYVDRIAIGKLMTVADVGLFGVGYRVASITALLLMGFQAAITPLVYQNYKRAETPAELAQVFRAFSAVAILFSLGLAMFADDFVVIFTTEPFYGGAQVVPLLAPALILAGMYVFAPGLAIENRTGKIGVINVAGAALGTLLNLLLIPVLGIQGAALATLVAAAFTFGISMSLSQRVYHVPHQWGPLAAAAGVGVALFLATQALDGTGWLETVVECAALAMMAGVCIATNLIKLRA